MGVERALRSVYFRAPPLSRRKALMKSFFVLILLLCSLVPLW